MKTKARMTRSELAVVLLVFGLFVLALFLSDKYKDVLLNIPLLSGGWGMFAYFLLAIVATVLAPFSSLPLLPVASTIWGPLATAVLSILGWGLGALLAFVVARRYGKPLVSRFVDITKAERMAQVIAGTNTFWSIVLVRMLLPTDLLSYAIGLFLPVSFRTYALATFTGITPFAFIFSYTNELPPMLQGVLILSAFVLILFFYKRLRAWNMESTEES